MKKSTSFDLKDAEALLKQLQQFSETLQQQWLKVLSQWSNLKETWHDEQFDKFDLLFEKISANYDKALLECENYIGFLKTKIKIAEQHSFNLLKALERPIAIAQMGTALLGINASSVPQSSDRLTQQSGSSYVQEKDPNSCSLDNKLDPEKSPAVQRYNSMPGIARAMSAEDLANEAYSQERERETKRTKKEAEISINAGNLPTTSNPSTFTHSVTEFANSLNYPITYDSFKIGESNSIKATTSNGRYIDCFINFEFSEVGRIRIQDIVVAPNYQHKGVGTKLLKALENNLTNGTVLYFHENQAPNFWIKMGFQATTNNGVIEYWKIVSHPANTR